MRKTAEPAGKVLIVDDDRFVRMALSEALRTWEYEIVEADTVKAAKKVFVDEEPEIVLLDIDLPDGSGLDVLNEIKESNPDTIVVMITGNVDVSNSVGALRGGAHDFIGKPVRLEELRVTLRNASETRTLRREVKQARAERKRGFSFSEIIGESDSMKKAIELARRVAESDVGSILLNGETGTGKDLFARAIHYASERADSPYLAINCAALPANLIESELFGYEKGAFTDAKQKKEGLFEQAHGGTIFLDEIGEMEISLQAKLLRVLEESTFRRVGGLKDIKMDARIIAASNRNLKQESEVGNFRLDLYFRLSVIQVDIPPLRDRGDDVVLLANYYIEKANLKRRGKQLRCLSHEVEQIFKNYSWSGNVRELRNIIERASILEDGDMVTVTHLPADILSTNSASGAGRSAAFILPPGGVPLESVEFDLAIQAIDRTNGNLTQAAKLLDISRDQLRYKLRKAGYDHEAGDE
ncbi:MAG: sigma-54-dependent Fis family transcriptional regulator [Pyrinomonadaceae bacterium]|nr:sigma-54-dependent Fis family transcriptional regulator [Acidobacteriota bacterium]MBP7375601.1 sigma-54-dependent Fis family transcriptional regulator [Pyrinomonadaceae bacterium]